MYNHTQQLGICIKENNVHFMNPDRIHIHFKTSRAKVRAFLLIQCPDEVSMHVHVRASGGDGILGPQGNSGPTFNLVPCHCLVPSYLCISICVY